MHDMDEYEDYEVDQEVNDWIATCENTLNQFNILKIKRDVINTRGIHSDCVYTATSIIHQFYANDELMKKYNKLNNINKEEK